MPPKPAKKHLGQNFLTSVPARIAIVEAGKLSQEDTVLEIGPGRGFLTEGLLDSGAQIIALEKDTDLIPLLTEKFSSRNNFTLIEGDALTYTPPKGRYKIIANIPYYITGAILRYYISHPHPPTDMVVLVQKEVAERIVAKDGKHSILSLSVQAYGKTRIAYRVNKGSFNPAPKVDSAVLSIETISRNNFSNQYHEDIYFKVLHAGFAHKRKLLISNLRDVFPHIHHDELFTEIQIPLKARAEDVTLSQWLHLSLNISTHS